MMQSALLMEGGLPPDMVHDLSPSQLRSYYRDLVRQRAARQREQLHIEVSAAAVISDGGKLARQQDSALSDAAGQKSVPPERQEAVEAKPISAREAAEIDQEFAKVDHLWTK